MANSRLQVELSQGLASLLEEAMSLAASRHDVRYPPIGACLLAFITDGEMDVYKEYADSFELANSTLNSMCEDPAVVTAFEVWQLRRYFGPFPTCFAALCPTRDLLSFVPILVEC